MKKNILLLLGFAFLAATFSAFSHSGSILALENIAVTSTSYGKVRGYIDNGIFAFKGKDYIFMYGYDASNKGLPKLIVKKMAWVNGWPSINPLNQYFIK